MFYKLDEDKNVILTDIIDWANFIEGGASENYKTVGKDKINKLIISTVFLGLCHNYSQFPGRPIVFKTMIFKGKKALGYQERYSTWQQAEEGHQRAIEWVKNGCKENHEDLIK